MEEAILAANNTRMDTDGFNYATRFLKCENKSKSIRVKPYMG
jgi:hypothetical protein